MSNAYKKGRPDQIRAMGADHLLKIFKKISIGVIDKKRLAILVQNDFEDKVIKVNFWTCFNLCSLG